MECHEGLHELHSCLDFLRVEQRNGFLQNFRPIVIEHFHEWVDCQEYIVLNHRARGLVVFFAHGFLELLLPFLVLNHEDIPVNRPDKQPIFVEEDAVRARSIDFNLHEFAIVDSIDDLKRIAAHADNRKAPIGANGERARPCGKEILGAQKLAIHKVIEHRSAVAQDHE